MIIIYLKTKVVRPHHLEKATVTIYGLYFLNNKKKIYILNDKLFK